MLVRENIINYMLILYDRITNLGDQTVPRLGPSDTEPSFELNKHTPEPPVAQTSALEWICAPPAATAAAAAAAVEAEEDLVAANKVAPVAIPEHSICSRSSRTSGVSLIGTTSTAYIVTPLSTE
jgi:hypothetical protein